MTFDIKNNSTGREMALENS